MVLADRSPTDGERSFSSAMRSKPCGASFSGGGVRRAERSGTQRRFRHTLASLLEALEAGADHFGEQGHGKWLVIVISG